MGYICNACDVTVVGTGSDGTNPCLVFTASSSPPPSPEPAPPRILAQYMFNIGEGLSRFSGECRVKLSNVKVAYLLGVGSEHHCGLAGLIQSLSTAGKETLNVFGPKGTMKLVDGTSRLLNKRYPEVYSTDFCLDEDEESASFAISEDDPFLDVKCGLSRVKGDARDSAAGQGIIKRSRTVVFYRCQVRRTKHYHQSCFGSTPDNDTKRPVLSPLPTTPSFMVIFCADSHEAAAVSCHPLFVADEPVDFVFHFTDSKLMKDPSYAPILNAFNGRRRSTGRGFKNCCQHIVVNAGGGHGVVYNRASAVLSTWLYAYSPRVFPLHSAFVDGATTSANEIDEHHPHVATTTTCLDESASLTKSGEKEMEVDCKTNKPAASPQDNWVQGEVRLRVVLLPEIDMGIKRDNILAPLDFKGIIELSNQRIAKLQIKDICEVFNLSLFPPKQPPHYTNQQHHDQNHTAALVLRNRLRQKLHRGGLSDTDELAGRNRNLVATSSSVRKRQQLCGGTTANNKNLAEFGHFFFYTNPDRLLHADTHMSGLLKKRMTSNGEGFLLTPVSEDDRIMFLGTGSAAPSKLRGSSGLLLICKGLNMLLDAGEGTYGHLVRHFDESLSIKAELHRKGEKGTLEVLCGLDAIWISHKHADHTCGLWRLLCLRRVALCSSHVGSEVAATLYHPHHCVRSSPSLLLVAPSPVLEWIRSCEAAEAHCSRGSLSYTAVDPFLYHICHLPVADLESVPVEHCYRAYGLVVRLKVCGKTIVYSGDTRPSDALIRAGRDSTLLVHEATFDDDMADHAISKRHSTVSEALSVGHRMKTQAIILTHFSQRYPLLPPLASIKPTGDDKGKDMDENVGYSYADIPVAAAYDGMVVPIAMASKLSQLHTLVRGCLLEGLPDVPCMKWK